MNDRSIVAQVHMYLGVPERYPGRLINYLWDVEHLYEFHPEYSLDRLRPKFGDYLEFVEFLGFPAIRGLYYQGFTLHQVLQIFLTWLTDCALGKNESAVYYIALIGSLRPIIPALIGGLPPLSVSEPSQIRDEKPADYRRFCQR